MKLKKENYYSLVGLLTLAKAHRTSLEEIEKEVMKIVGETEESGHSGDAVWAGASNADQLLKNVEARKKWEVKHKKV